MPGRSFGEGWTFEFVEYVTETLDIGPGTEVFEVACASGEFLIPLHDNGYTVGGLDADPALVARARQAMPVGRFMVGSPADLDPALPWHVVICRAFGSFPDPGYARGVLARMAAKATHALAVLDLPEAKFERSWMLHALAEIGVTAVQIETSKVDGSKKDEPRFNIFARL